MGVYIKDMEMPTDDMKNIMILADCRVFQFSGYGNPKPLGTAVHVPPHGRLIDADAFVEKCEEMADKEDRNQLDALVLMRWFLEQNAPTIIPAEEAE